MSVFSRVAWCRLTPAALARAIRALVRSACPRLVPRIEACSSTALRRSAWRRSVRCPPLSWKSASEKSVPTARMPYIRAPSNAAPRASDPLKSAAPKSALAQSACDIRTSVKRVP